MKPERRLRWYFLYVGLLTCLINAIAASHLLAEDINNTNKIINPVGEIITFLYHKLVDFLGNEALAIFFVALVGGVVTYIFKDAIPTFCKWSIAKVIGVFHNLRGRNLPAYRASIINQCQEIRVGYKNFTIDVRRDYVSLQIKTGTTDQDVELKDVETVLREHQRLVVRGHPGSGKTTLLKYLAIRYASKKMKSLHGKHLIPFFISLKDVPVPEDSAQLFDYIAERIKLYFSHPEDYLRTQLKDGNCIVLLDGVDEVRSELMSAVLKGIEIFANDFDKVYMIATVRKEGYEKIGLDARFKETFVAGLTVPQMETLTLNVLQSNQPGFEDGERNQQCSDLIARVKDNPRLLLLAENPMLLSIIALVFDEQGDLPRKRIDLYESCLKLILELREIREARITHRFHYSFDQKYYALRKLALYFIERNMSQFPGSLLKNELKEIAPSINLQLEKVDIFIDELCKIGILRKISTFDDSYDFVHKTFLEYLAAREIQENLPDKERMIFDHAEDPVWREVVLLYVGLLSEPGRFIEILMNRGAVALAGESFLNARIQTDAMRTRLIDLLSVRVIEGGIDKDRITGVLIEMILPCLNALIDESQVQDFLEGRVNDPLERMETKAAIYKAGLVLEPDAAAQFGERFDLVYIPAGESWIGEDSSEPKASSWRRIKARIHRAKVLGFLPKP